MTHEELLAYINKDIDEGSWFMRENQYFPARSLFALRAVVELHKAVPYTNYRGQQIYFCNYCMDDEINNTDYPCPTIQAIERELQ